MRTQHHDTCSAAAPDRLLSVVASPSAQLTIALGLANSASAALIVDALDYDGHVRNGLVTGVEAHTARATPFPPPNRQHPAACRQSTADFAVACFEKPDDDRHHGVGAISGSRWTALSTAIIQISAASGNVFANPLDNTLTYPVEVDISVYSNTPGMKLVLNPVNIGIENFDLPPFSHPYQAPIRLVATELRPTRSACSSA